MADTTQTKILEVVVDNNKAVAAISEYNRLIDEQRQKQQQLAKDLKEGKISQSEYYKAMAQSKEETKAYSRQVQELSKEVQNNIKMDTEKAGSLRGLRAELSNVTKAYDELSEEERKSAEGLELKAKIQDITTQLKNSEAETGRFYRNVGNYANGFVEAFTRMGGSMGKMQGPINMVKNGFNALSSTPIIAILGALVSIIQKVIQNLKSSEASMQAVAVAMAPLNAAGRVMQVVMQKLGEGIAKVVTKLTEWADKLGLITDAMKVEQQLVKDEIALQMREREVIMQNADSQLKVAQLKAQAADKLNYSAKERVAFLESALAEEDAIAKRELELAKERYRIQVEQSKLAENSTEENDELARSYATMRQAETDYFNKSRELTAQLVEAKKQMAAESKAAGDASIKDAEAELTALAQASGMSDEQIQKQLDIRKREIEARLKLVEEGSLAEYSLKQEQLKADYDLDMQRLAQEEGTDELRRLRKEQFTQDMTALEQSWTDEMEALSDELTQEIIANTLAVIEAERKEAEEEKQMQEARRRYAEETAFAFSDVAGSIADMLATVGDENKQLTQLSKIIALAQIAIETGVATARGISAAMAAGPFPANLAAIATTIATITAGITSAIASVKSAKFATGGYVSGPGSGTSDSVPAMLSNGESVMNARSTAMFGPLLSSLNQAGGGIAFNPSSGGQREGYQFLAAAVAAGMKSVKLNVGVDEVTRVQNRVEQIKEISEL
jgi:hypothetical protein